MPARLPSINSGFAGAAAATGMVAVGGFTVLWASSRGPLCDAAPVNVGPALAMGEEATPTGVAQGVVAEGVATTVAERVDKERAPEGAPETDNAVLPPSPPPSRWAIVCRILRLLLNDMDWVLVSVSSLAVLLGGVAGVAQAGAVGSAFAAVTDGHRGYSAVRNLLLLYLCNAGLSFASNTLMSVAINRLSATLQMKVFSAVIDQDMAFFDQRTLGCGGAASGVVPVGVMVVDDVRELCDAVKHLLLNGIAAAAQLVGGTAALFAISKEMALIGMVGIPITTAAFNAFASYMRHFSRDAQAAQGRASTLVSEAVFNIKVVQAYTGQEQEIERFGSEVRSGLHLKHRLAMLRGAFFSMAGLALNAVTLVVMYSGSHLVAAGAVSKENVKVFLDQTRNTIGAVNKLIRLFGELNEASQAGERVFSIIDSRPPINRGIGAAADAVPERAEGQVQFADVSFSYPTRPNVQVLTNFNVQLRPGTVTALVGESGSGKSTVAWLLERFFDPSGGTVTLDGQDIRQLDPHWLRQQIGLVNQEPSLFASTVAENIRYGNPNADDASVREAARLANADEFIQSLPLGYDTLLQAGGGGLSGGQKQRIAIARALLKDPPILVLDEATSALDGKSEHAVQAALQRLLVGRTTLVIAHRLSSIRQADNIVVMQAGQCVAAGTHADLLAKGGVYADLMHHQQQRGKPTGAR